MTRRSEGRVRALRGRGKEEEAKEDRGDSEEETKNDGGDGEDEVFEVEDILDVDNDDAAGPRYEVKWVGFEETTFEPEGNLPKSKLLAFKKRHAKSQRQPTAQAKSAKSQRQAAAPAKTANVTAATRTGTAAPVTAVLAGRGDEGEETEDDGGDGEDEVFEVEDILDVDNDDAAGPRYEVKWVGFEETTFEPEGNLPKSMLHAFKKRHAKSQRQPTAQAKSAKSQRQAAAQAKTAKSQMQPAAQGKTANVAAVTRTGTAARETADLAGREDGAEEETKQARGVSAPLSLPVLCATCDTSVEIGASCCHRCKRPMHHFCAHDVCGALGLTDDSGNAVTEFPNDLCFCSTQCYSNRERPTRVVTTKRGRQGHGYRLDSDVDTDMENDPKKHKTSPREADGTYVEIEEDAKKPRTLKAKAVKPSAKKGSQLPKPTRKKAQGEVRARATKPPKDVTAAKPNPYVGKMVAFCAEHETWMPDRDYKAVKDFFLSGRVFLYKKKAGEVIQEARIYEIRWSYTQFQGAKHSHRVNADTVKRGIRNMELLSGSILSSASWRAMCSTSPSEKWDDTKSLDDYVIYEGSARSFETRQLLPETLEDVEQITNLDFQASRKLKEPGDLFKMSDGNTKTRVRPEYADRFARSASSSFLAYLPVSFWKKVVTESNAYSEDDKAAAITLNEMMKFLGILFYMTVVEKGEYSNYWGEQAEDRILGNPGTGLDEVMALKRFQFIRKSLCFRHGVTKEQLDDDPAARIRPLMNILKHTSPQYVELGRNVAVDESSIACRSKFGRHLIVFNSSKPTGKFHFKIYTCCCSTTWLMVGFRLHCSSSMKARLNGVVSTLNANELENRLQYSSEIRRHVLEVTHSLHGTKRIVNTDNFYTSVLLLMSLKQVGLYGRGTVRENSKHFPKAHMFSKNATEARGTMMQGVSVTGNLVAASWMDGNAVNIISNADSSEQGEVRRMIGSKSQVFPAPKCIAEYNQNMQGVDRMDQLRAQFSLADGHSFQKWHKKLALAFIDIARCNAYVTRRMVLGEQAASSRNPHRDFVVELAGELISGRWAEWSEDEGMFYADPVQETDGGPSASPSRTPPRPRPAASPSTPSCDFILSKIQFPKATRGKRGCKVCIFEGRYETEKTNYCITHNVCLCSSTYPVSDRFQGIVCPYEDWSCWRKYHEYYLPRGLFNARGRIKRGSALLKAKRELRMFEEADAVAHETPIDTTTSLVNDGVNDGVRQAEESPAADAASPSIRSDTVLVSPQWYPNTPSFSLASTTPSSEYI